jgi:putative glycosyltransferase (TIGR04372 family)
VEKGENLGNIFLLSRKVYSVEHGKYLSLRELHSLGLVIALGSNIFSNKLAGGISSEELTEMGLELVSNTPREILQIVREVESRLSGTWVETELDRELQALYRSIIREIEGLDDDFEIKYRFGADFLRENAEWFLK